MCIRDRKKLDQILQNEEIRTIISALGAGIGNDFDLEDLRYHKVIILSDADQDGAHIREMCIRDRASCSRTGTRITSADCPTC